MKLWNYQFMGELHFEETEWIEGIVIAENLEEAKQKIFEEYIENIPLVLEDIDVQEFEIEGYKITVEKR